MRQTCTLVCPERLCGRADADINLILQATCLFCYITDQLKPNSVGNDATQTRARDPLTPIPRGSTPHHIHAACRAIRAEIVTITRQGSILSTLTICSRFFPTAASSPSQRDNCRRHTTFSAHAKISESTPCECRSDGHACMLCVPSTLSSTVARLTLKSIHRRNSPKARDLDNSTTTESP